MGAPRLGDPGEPLRHATDHILVRFAPSVSAADRQRITRDLGGREYVPARRLDFGRVYVSAGEDAGQLLTRFRSDPRIDHVELDFLYRLYGPQDPFEGFQWNLDRIRMREAEQINQTRGSGAVVAIVDTGVAYSGPLAECTDLDQVSFVPGISFFLGRLNPFDDVGHGTFIATQIAAPVNGRAGRGMAPSVSIMPIKACGTICEGNQCFQGVCLSGAVAEGIAWATDHGADVINLSLGGPQRSQLGREAVQYAHQRGVVVVAASGNESEPGRIAPVSFPAAYPEVIAVGATDFDDRRAVYSNAGPELDLVAPVGSNFNRVVGQHRGQAVRDATAGGFVAFDPVRRVYVDCGWHFNLGTSFAAPQVAAAAALFKAFGVRDPEDIRTLLVQSARDIGPQGFDTSTGFGVLDIFEANSGSGFSFE